MQVDDEINHPFIQHHRADPFTGTYNWVQTRAGLHGAAFDAENISEQFDFAQIPPSSGRVPSHRSQ